MMDEIAKNAISPDDAVEKYLEGIEKNQLYVFDSLYYYDLLAMKGKDPQQYENVLVEGITNRNKTSRDHFHKHGINIEDYL